MLDSCLPFTLLEWLDFISPDSCCCTPLVLLAGDVPDDWCRVGADLFGGFQL